MAFSTNNENPFFLTKNIKNTIKGILKIYKNNDNFSEDENLFKTIENHKLFQDGNIELLNKKELYVRLCAFALDTRNSELLNHLLRINSIEFKIDDIILEIYKDYSISPGSLTFILQKKDHDTILSSLFLQKLMRNKENKLLNVILNYLGLVENEGILKFCYCYKYRKPLSPAELNYIILKYITVIVPPGNTSQFIIDACNYELDLLIYYLINSKFDVNKRSDNGRHTPLIDACEKGNSLLIKHLIQLGAKVNLKCVRYSDTFDEIKMNSFLYSIFPNRKYYFHEYDYHFGLETNEYPLTIACKKGNEALVKYLMECGANSNIEIKTMTFKKFYYSRTFYDEYHYETIETPLSIACERGKIAIAKFLMACGADVNVKLKTNFILKKNFPSRKKIKIVETLLSVACRNGNEALIRYLVEYGADVNIPLKTYISETAKIKEKKRKKKKKKEKFKKEEKV